MEDGHEKVAAAVVKVSSLVESRDSLTTNDSGHAEDADFAVCNHEKDEVLLEIGSSKVSNQEGTAEGESSQDLALAEAAEERALQEEEEHLQEDLALGKETDRNGSKAVEFPDEKNRRTGVSTEVLASIKLARECLMEITERFDTEQGGWGCCRDDVESRPPEEGGLLLWEAKSVRKLGNAVKSALAEHEERRKKERKELESKILCLTEENRDISELLGAALAGKRGRGPNGAAKESEEHPKRGAILQIAERGLQKVGFGFGFVVASLGGDLASDDWGNSNASAKSDDSDIEEGRQRTRLENTIEMIMKNLRLEIADLKKALEESRSDSEHLRSLAEKQAQEIDENTLYIKVLEERESLLNQNVMDLNVKVKEAEEEVLRWREACELEVEAGNTTIKEHERKSAVLREDLRRTKAALGDANRRLMVKEKLVATAMAAQAAAEASLRIADGRCVGLRERIEELTKQLEEEAERGRKQRGGGRRKLRHVCWPWQALSIIGPYASGGQAGRNPRRRIPEMMALLP